MTKAAEAFRTIGEVADELDVPKHVLRFWEGKFPHIRPMKRGGGRRYYRPEDLELLRGIRHLLHAEGYTIKGVQKILREQGVDVVKAAATAALKADAAQALAKKRGRKPLIAGEIADKQDAPAAAIRTADAAAIPGAVSDATQKPGERPSVAGLPSRAIIAAAIRELETCRQILMGSSAAGRMGDIQPKRLRAEQA